MAVAAGGPAPAPAPAHANANANANPTPAGMIVGRAKEALEHFRAVEAARKAEQRAKPDMIAYSELLKGRLAPARVHGHPPGVGVGAHLRGRGEAAAVGVHMSMLRGIDYKKGQPAYAVCLCGSYKDDNDEGEGGRLVYVGEGGRGKNSGGPCLQVEDQTLTRGNQALADAHDSRTPVRLLRGRVVKGGVKGGGSEGSGVEYHYGGLFMIESYTHEPSSDGPLVFRFHLVPVALESVHRAFRVEFRKSAAWRAPKRALAGADDADGVERKRARKAQAAAARARGGGGVSSTAWRPAGEVRVCEDASGGVERVKIAVYNGTGDGQAAFAPDGFRYVRSCAVADASAAALASLEQIARMPPERCSVPAVNPRYTRTGHLIETCPDGLLENAAPGSDLAPVAGGVRLPLEVFRTSDGRGWGLRCAEQIFAGEFVCEYAGELRSSLEVEQGAREAGSSVDTSYLFDLDHFISDDLTEDNSAEEDKLELVVDGFMVGSAARWINHSSEPRVNLHVQPAFTPQDQGPHQSRFLYRIALFALRDIPPGEELTYNYGHNYWGADAENAITIE